LYATALDTVEIAEQDDAKEEDIVKAVASVGALEKHLVKMEDQGNTYIVAANLDKKAQDEDEDLIQLLEFQEKLATLQIRLSSIQESIRSHQPKPQNQSKVNQMHQNMKINEALKPEKLHVSATLAEFRAWRKNFELYYQSNNMSSFPIEQQQGYLRNCIELKLQQVLDTKIKDDTSIFGDDGIIAILKSIYLQQIPVLTRRFNFFKCNQKPGESFSDWTLRLQLEGQEAELENLTVDELYLTQMVCGTNDHQLQEEFLRMDNPTREQIYNKGMSWERARLNTKAISGFSVANGMRTSTIKTKNQRSKARTTKQKLEGKCFRCGRPCTEHSSNECIAKNKKCRNCGNIGHFAHVCLGGGRGTSRNQYERGRFSSRSQSREPSRQRSESRCQKNECQDEERKSRVGNSSVRILSINDWRIEHPTPLVKVEIHPVKGRATPFSFEVLPDTGATEALISADLIRTYGFHIDKSKRKSIFTANDSKMDCTGVVNLLIKNREYEAEIVAYVTPDIKETIILAWHNMIDLGIIPATFPNLQKDIDNTDSQSLKFARNMKTSICQEPSNEEARSIILKRIEEKFPNVFEECQLKPMKGKAMHIHLKPDAKIIPTHVTAARSIPFAFRDAAKEELDYMVREGIIESVDEPSDWVSPFLVVPKTGKRGVRLVVDYRGLNRFVKRPEHPFPSPMELSSSIPIDAKWFAVFDAIKGYWQIKLDDESKPLTTFLTPWGRYRYMRAPMGLNASGDEFCRRGDLALVDLPYVRKIVDDILVFAESFEELMSRIETVLDRCDKNHITLSKSKCQIGKQVKFAGFVVNEQGVQPDPVKVKAISKFPSPTNVTELRSFLGLVNQLAQFVPNVAHTTEPLRDLLKKSVAFQWLDEHQRAFEEVKQLLTDPSGMVLAHYDPNLPTSLLTDASRLKGIGFALVQTRHDGSTALIQCGSRFLSDAESRYATCEIEMLAICWAVQKCRLYLMGRYFEVFTDHRPLIGVFKGTRFDSVENPRLQRFLQKLSPYTFDVKWVAGKQHLIADALSRAPIENPELHEEQDIACSPILIFESSIESKDRLLEVVIEEAEKDINYQSIKTCLMEGAPVKNLPSSHPANDYVKVWDHLSIDEDTGLLLYEGSRMVIPKSCRQRILEAVHKSHLGISKTRHLVRQLYYWPGFSNEVTEMIQRCHKCQEFQNTPSREPLVQSKAAYPFQKVSVDLFEYGNKHFLIMVDRYSGWPLLSDPISKTNTSNVLKIVKNWIVEWGIPQAIRSDGGPQFRGEFDQFCQENGIIHELSSAYNPESNGHAEAAVKSMKLLVKKYWESGNINLVKLRKAIMEWRNTPRSEGISPAQYVFGRRQRTSIPILPDGYKRISENEIQKGEKRREKSDETIKQYHDQGSHLLPSFEVGDVVRVQDQRSKKWDRTGKVVDVRPGGRSYFVELLDGKVILRNRRYLKGDMT
jgi:hypothetical protein